MSTFFHHYTDEYTKIPFICEFEFEEAEIGSIDSYGLKVEPDYPEQLYVLRIWIDMPGMDKYNLEPLINDETKKEMCDEAYEAYLLWRD